MRIAGGLPMRVADGAGVLYAYDANGNVGQLVDAEDRTNMVARYEYDPYGNVLVAQGDAAEGNPFRFSTKYTDDETKLVYYGLRSYSPQLGRWMSRDPIGEHAFGETYLGSDDAGVKHSTLTALAREEGMHGYAFVRNAASQFVDSLGAFKFRRPPVERELPPPHHPKAIEVVKVAPCKILVVWGHWREKEEDFRPNQVSEGEKVKAAAMEAAKAICGRKQCCCKKVKVVVETRGLEWDEKLKYPRPFSDFSVECKQWLLVAACLVVPIVLRLVASRSYETR